MTGAPGSRWRDAVVMIEYTMLQGDRVAITKGVASGDNIVPVGSEAHKSQILMQPGTRMDFAGIGLAASVGLESLTVYRRPKVAILSTGDEIVEIGTQPGPHQIRNSNSYSLAAQVTAAGGESNILSIARDERSHLQTLIEQGLQSDLLLLSGGVSMGKYDLVEQVLAEFGAEFFFTGAQIQPGPRCVRPCQDGLLRAARNPISTMVTFELFAEAIVEALAGMAPRPLQSPARLKTELRLDGRRFLDSCRENLKTSSKVGRIMARAMWLPWGDRIVTS
jgi:molybdopterin molybdotransferase